MASRIFVQESIADKFIQVLKSCFEQASNSGIIGDPSDENTQVGPLADKAQFKRVMEYLDIGKKEGELVTGGVQWGAKDGLYVKPTIFKNLGKDSRIVREEVFGPVVTVQTFSSEEDAIKLANDSIFGLSGESCRCVLTVVSLKSYVVVQPASIQDQSVGHFELLGRLKRVQLLLTTGTFHRPIRHSEA